MAKSYIYRLVVCVDNYIVKSFLGNDKNALAERFEKWFIKQSYDRQDVSTYIDYVQHAGY